MATSRQHRDSIFGICPCTRTQVFGPALLVTFALTLLVTQAAQAQTFTVLHTFTGGQDGAYSFAGVTLDQAGNLYGTATSYVGDGGYGTVFKLKRSGSSYLFNLLYSFTGGNDGALPESGVVFGPDGSLYGAQPRAGRMPMAPYLI